MIWLPICLSNLFENSQRLLLVLPHFFLVLLQNLQFSCQLSHSRLNHIQPLLNTPFVPPPVQWIEDAPQKHQHKEAGEQVGVPCQPHQPVESIVQHVEHVRVDALWPEVVVQ